MDATPDAFEVAFQASLLPGPGPLGLRLANAGFRLTPPAPSAPAPGTQELRLSASAATFAADAPVIVGFPELEASFSLDPGALEGPELRLGIEGAPGEIPVRFESGEPARALAAVAGRAQRTVVVTGRLTGSLARDFVELRAALISVASPDADSPETGLADGGPEAIPEAGRLAQESAIDPVPVLTAPPVAEGPEVDAGGSRGDDRAAECGKVVVAEPALPPLAQSGVANELAIAQEPVVRSGADEETEKASTRPARKRRVATPTTVTTKPSRPARRRRSEARTETAAEPAGASSVPPEGESVPDFDFATVVRQIISEEVEQRAGKLLAQLDLVTTRLREAASLFPPELAARNWSSRPSQPLKRGRRAARGRRAGR